MLVEGAGSAAEVNLRANDIANMGFARAADVPVVLIGDIDRGGVIASLVGTKAVIAPDDAALICGFIVNKFRGDAGAVRCRHGAHRATNRLDSAWAGAVFSRCAAVAGGGRAGARTRSAPAKAHARAADRRADPAAHRQFRRPRSARCRARGRGCPGAAGRGAARRRRSHRAARLESDDCRSRRRCVLPASTSTSPRICAAAEWFSVSAAVIRCWDAALPIRKASKAQRRDRRRSWSARRRHDAVPARSGSNRCAGTTNDGAPFAGYEMHMGVTEGPDCARPFARLADGSPEGAISADGRVIGTYVHGLFADDRQRASVARAFRRAARQRSPMTR